MAQAPLAKKALVSPVPCVSSFFSLVGLKTDTEVFSRLRQASKEGEVGNASALQKTEGEITLIESALAAIKRGNSITDEDDDSHPAFLLNTER